MLKSGLLLGLIIIVSVFAACEKPEAYNADAQLEIDEAIIKDWAAKNDVTLKRDESGLYYRIKSPGKDTVGVSPTDTLTVECVGKLLTDSVFIEATATSPYKFIRESVMPGWVIGLSLIKQGGQIELLVPSLLGYKNYPVQDVPANSVLHFDIDLKKVAKKIEKKVDK